MRELVWIAALLALAGCNKAALNGQLGTENTVGRSGGPPPVSPGSPESPLPSTGANSPVPALIVDTSSQFEKHFQALGTEPFWSIEVVSGKLLYTSPEQPVPVAIAARIVTTIGKELRYAGEMSGKPVTLTIEAGACSDGMSDTVYSHKATFVWSERTEQGCAKKL